MIKKILIIKLGALGDVLRTTSILEPLKKKHQRVKITFVTNKNAVVLLETNPLIDNVIAIDESPVVFLQNKIFDLVVSLDDQKEACSLASTVSAKRIIGAYLKEGRCVYTEDSALWFDMGLISYYGKEEADKRKATNKKTYQTILFSILGLSNPDQYPPKLFLQKAEEDFASAFAQRHGIKKSEKVIGFNTGAGGRWKDKKLSVEQTVLLIDMLTTSTQARFLLFGGLDERERNCEILEKVKAPLIDTGCNNSLIQFATLLNLCDVVVTSDSLAMHIALALGKKVVAFFYPTSAAEIEIYGGGKKIIAEGKSYCSYESVCTYPPIWDIRRIANSALSLLREK